MLVKICKGDGIPLVNIVRKSEHVELLKELGAEYVCNTSDESFMDDLVAALIATGATLGFDATGGGNNGCLLYTSPSPRDQRGSRMPSSA